MVKRKTQKSELPLLQTKGGLEPLEIYLFNLGLLKDFYEEQDSELEKSSFLPGFFQLGIDHTQFAIPYMQKLQPTTEYEKDGSIVGEVSWIFDIQNNRLLDCVVGDFDDDVSSQTMDHIVILDRYFPKMKTVLEFDYGYFSLEAMHFLSFDRNKKFIFRLDDKHFEEFQNQLKPGEEKVVQFQLTVAQTREYRLAPKLRNEMLSTIYKIRFAKPIIGVTADGSPKYVSIATNIFPKETSLDVLIDAYRDRWNAEESYDYLKNNLMIEEFYGNDIQVILRQIFAAWIVFNSVSPAKMEAGNIVNEAFYENMANELYFEDENGQKICWKDLVNHIDEVEADYSAAFKKGTNDFFEVFCEDDPTKILRALGRAMIKLGDELLPVALIREKVKQEAESGDQATYNFLGI
ncbi:MAG: hypothetical protein Q4A59_01965 [Erysipelotrichaceae bacterium]|nr:hypothetical protein [Erysipelotrichaceae bacterium]